ncbi:MAG TPA: hypothetical protein VJ861_11580 [Treponemataceae bacterium]|nr:hypothetical protein [Treponemataceae bacterium]
MAIQPIDLQTLYTQLDKIGKGQIEVQLAAQANKEQGRLKNIQEAEEKLRTVYETEAGDEKSDKVHDKNSSPNTSSHQQSSKKELATTVEEKEPKKEVISDPALGSHIDISG